ncbi:putative mannan endo-1,4-beta-mannosidase 9 [Malus sylvestris]|uniref:putative mannan endo-1,4-beta-mannosidase 9 n=1 Tax=Malus sylvestris TaxID=3752 RepID=UPI0021ACC63D|nr:putative mannan endo-1,4-beta-mannosidase 9 [Malus sylvestris]
MDRGRLNAFEIARGRPLVVVILAGTQGTRFVMNGKPFYINGFNAYWMMYMASDPSTRAKTLLTRKNSITKVAYKNDPTIFAWELMNEPRCQSDVSGSILQPWVKEMAAHFKYIDSKHLLEIGLEGFYGKTTPDKKQFNPGNLEYGSEFIASNLLPDSDFATIHIYAEQWLPETSEEGQAGFVDKWVQQHIEDCNTVVKKPLVLGEFGKSYRLPGYTPGKRNAYFRKLYEYIYTSASSGGSLVGGIFWQLIAQGMDTFGDGYEVVLEESPTTANVIAYQSSKLGRLNYD